jgi:MbtH protein
MDKDMAGSNDLNVIVRNHEEQYSIWPGDEAVPTGWVPIGVPGTKSECLDRMRELWTDMRPASLRAHMDRGTASVLAEGSVA